MRFVLSVFLIAVFSLLLELILPWYFLALAGFLTGFGFGFSSLKSFLSGFSGIMLLWLVAGLIMDYRNGHLLSARMAVLLKLPSGFIFILVTSLIGGIAGGLSSWSGAVLRKYLLQRETVSGNSRKEERSAG